jgi:hypothetical protein
VFLKIPNTKSEKSDCQTWSLFGWKGYMSEEWVKVKTNKIGGGKEPKLTSEKNVKTMI